MSAGAASPAATNCRNQPGERRATAAVYSDRRSAFVSLVQPALEDTLELSDRLWCGESRRGVDSETWSRDGRQSLNQIFTAVDE